MGSGHTLKVLGIIPARYGSTRFPGKPLVEILGKSLIQHTYENAKRSASLAHVVVATDDVRIYNHVLGFGGHAVMTDVACPTGTDRLVKAIEANKELGNSPIILNIQGDEPCLAPSVIDAVVHKLQNYPAAVMSTAISPIHSAQEWQNPSVVKCVVDKDGFALYFSRAPIPNNKMGQFDAKLPIYKHLGIYAYRSHFLFEYAKLPASPLQQCEDLEQLKVLEHGYRIQTVVTEHASPGVDTPEDIQQVEQWLCKQSTFLLQGASAPLLAKV